MLPITENNEVTSKQGTHPVASFNLIVYLIHEFHQLAVFPGYISIILCFMWQLAVRAVLDAVFFILKRAAAVAAQSVKRAVAEKTIEIFRVRALVAGKILAFFMRKIAVILRHIGSF